MHFAVCNILGHKWISCVHLAPEYRHRGRARHARYYDATRDAASTPEEYQKLSLKNPLQAFDVSTIGRDFVISDLGRFRRFLTY
jgi:hypothetical protein